MSKVGEHVKVLFEIAGEDGGMETESMWAESLGDDMYRLDNSPFIAYSVSWHDIVLAPSSSSHKTPTFERVVKKSGHKTLRVIFEEGASEDHPDLQALVKLGCSFEGASSKYFAIDVPPNADFSQVCGYLVSNGVQWEYVDPVYAELYPDDQ